MPSMSPQSALLHSPRGICSQLSWGQCGLAARQGCLEVTLGDVAGRLHWTGCSAPDTTMQHLQQFCWEQLDSGRCNPGCCFWLNFSKVPGLQHMVLLSTSYAQARQREAAVCQRPLKGLGRQTCTSSRRAARAASLHTASSSAPV